MRPFQDRCVQGLMDDLDLPPDRANLFEVAKTWKTFYKTRRFVASQCGFVGSRVLVESHGFDEYMKNPIDSMNLELKTFDINWKKQNFHSLWLNLFVFCVTKLDNDWELWWLVIFSIYSGCIGNLFDGTLKWSTERWAGVTYLKSWAISYVVWCQLPVPWFVSSLLCRCFVFFLFEGSEQAISIPQSMFCFLTPKIAKSSASWPNKLVSNAWELHRWLVDWCLFLFMEKLKQ